MTLNTLKTTLLLATLGGVLVAAGAALGGQQGMILAFGFAVVLNLGTWWFSDRIVLATSGAVPVSDPRLRWLVDDLEELSAKAGIPTPRLYLVPNEASPNAFATGRSPSKGVVAVTAGLLQALDRRQVKGVLAHELGHIAHRDTLINAVAASMGAAVSMLGRMAFWTGSGRDEDHNPFIGLVMMLLSPLVAMVIQMAISRTREYAADGRAAALTGDPEGLAQALERIGGIGRRVPMHTGSPSTHYIANNFAGGMAKWFSTHPPLEERIARLRARG